MLTTGALALVVVIFVGIVYVEADDHTYVVNKATVGMLATTSYGSGDSEFINRDVEPGAQDGDQYVTPSDADLSISITRKDNGASGSSTIVSDTSVICTMDGSTIVVSTSVYDDLNTADQQLFTLPGPDSTPFNSQPLTAAFPTDVRLATLQDANGNHDALGIVLPGSEVALLVDGWVTGEADAFQTGTDDRTDYTNKLGIVDSTAGNDPDLTSIDQVPDGADPNGQLQAYIVQANPQADLQPRVATFAPNPGPKATQQLKDVIAQWTLDIIDAGRRQQTIIPQSSGNPFRIDLQTNGAFDKTFYDENKQPYVVSCYQVAVQAGSDVYAAVLVPAGQFVSAGGVRKALFNSFEQSQVGSFVKPPKRYTGAYTWLVAIGGVILLVLNG